MKDFNDAFGDMIRNEKWKSKYYKANLRKDWEKLFGSMINNYTEDLRLVKDRLYITVSSAALRQELFNERESIKKQINDYYEEVIVNEIILK